MTRVLRSAAKKIQSKEDLSSNLSINKKSRKIQKKSKNVVEANNEGKLQNDIWNNKSIVYNIFAFIHHRELIEFNTVCKKWNHVSNPIIHKTIKLNRSWDIIKKSYDKKFKKNAKFDEDVAECISNNAKHAHFIKEFRYNYDLEPLRAIEVFETFRFISSLTIENCDMSQDQFLGMINPLTQLQELTLSGIGIKTIIRNRICKKAVQLPPTLKRLSLYYITLISNPELFTQTITSHNNLKDFFIHSQSSQVFLEPFYKPYPSLLKFEFNSYEVQTPQSLFTVFENNPQLSNLKLSLGGWSNELLNHIGSCLINLEELKLSENATSDVDFFAKFSQPTKIKKLNLEWSSLSNCTLNSILINCPHLEELILNRFNSYQRPRSISHIDLSKSSNIKKLAIDCNDLVEGVIESVLLSCPHLNDIDLILPWEWKGVMKSIYENCANLQRLAVCPSDKVYNYIVDTFYQEFYESVFFTSSHKYKSTLKNLTLNRFKVIDSNSEYFNNFKNLKTIKFPAQDKIINYTLDQKIDVNMDLWPGYELISKYIKNSSNCDIILKKIQN